MALTGPDSLVKAREIVIIKFLSGIIKIVTGRAAILRGRGEGGFRKNPTDTPGLPRDSPA